MLYFTEVIYGRARTEAETNQLSAYLTDPAVAAVTMSVNTQTTTNSDGITYSDNFIRLFSTEASADGYLAIVNSFTPAPQMARKLS